jgi:hypothetical protein
VFGLGAATRVYLAVGATDLRKGFEGLFGLVKDRLELELRAGMWCVLQRKRMAKKQQMQWTQRGAHLLLQVPTRVLNEENGRTYSAVGILISVGNNE